MGRGRAAAHLLLRGAVAGRGQIPQGCKERVGGEREKHWARLLIPGGGREGRKGGEWLGEAGQRRLHPGEQKEQHPVCPSEGTQDPISGEDTSSEDKEPQLWPWPVLASLLALASLSPSFPVHKMGLVTVAAFLGERWDHVKRELGRGQP